MEDNGADEEDEDGILPSVLEQRFEGEVVVNNWYALIKNFLIFFAHTMLKTSLFYRQV